MTKYKLEYIWLDGYTPVPNLRGKTQIKEFDSFPTLDQLPLWGFDGSSTMQAEGHSSDCVLKPVAVLSGRRAQERRAGHVRSHDAGRQHPASRRTSAPPSSTTPAPGSASSRNISSTRTAARSASPSTAIRRRRAPTTPASAIKNVGAVARKIVEEHLDLCLAAGINHEGINAEVAKGQWEFQIFGKGSRKRRRRDVDRPLPHDAPDREVRHRHRVPLQAARRHRLERLGHALPTSRPTTCAKSAARTISKP